MLPGESYVSCQDVKLLAPMYYGAILPQHQGVCYAVSPIKQKGI